MSDRKEVNLLLVGRTGNGKSSTGNSILGRKVFNASMNSEPLTEADIRLGTRPGAQPQITVVDGPGIGDVSCNDPDGVQRTIDLADNATSLCNDGFDAVLLILKYGERFTTQEKDAVRMVRSILGSKVLEQHGVVVMTQGDNFESDQEKDGMSFKDWCGQQTGDFAGIVQECNNRCVLFDNRTKEDKKLDRQRQKLLECVYKCDRYTKQDYDDAKVDRSRLKLVSEFDIMEKANREIVDEITHEINKLDISKNPNAATDKLTACQKRLDEHRDELEVKTNGTDVARTLLFELDIVAGSLTNKLEMAAMYLKLQEKAKRGKGERDKGKRDREENERDRGERDRGERDRGERDKEGRDREGRDREGRDREGRDRRERKRGKGKHGHEPQTGNNSKNQQGATPDKFKHNPATTPSSYGTTQLPHNPAATQSNQPTQPQARSDNPSTVKPHKSRFRKFLCGTNMENS